MNSDTKPKHTPSANTPGLCGICGGDYGIHRYETYQCPLGGFESLNIPQIWEHTHFINANFKRLQEAAPELLEALECLLSLGASEHFGKWDDWEEVKAAKEAIAKATGGKDE